eukprot:CAMPEP_0182801282 /NCGR_PEP_ID=MMETSP0006_2-20121128/2869_1 /TAXON_ID=97485 /ORGANISM="Prymnesium parvum, Strain Texoma1" /LENGTH=111 /DNA_ID=CAMNT_0024926593 /DNA_START=210 /DNA_END=545 /DNA_ORIENTATION=+
MPKSKLVMLLRMSKAPFQKVRYELDDDFLAEACDASLFGRQHMLSLGFCVRLMDDNGWSVAYCQSEGAHEIRRLDGVGQHELELPRVLLHELGQPLGHPSLPVLASSVAQH